MFNKLKDAVLLKNKTRLTLEENCFKGNYYVKWFKTITEDIQSSREKSIAPDTIIHGEEVKLVKTV